MIAFRRAFALALLAAVAGCTIESSAILYNHTGREIVLRYLDEERVVRQHTLAPGERVRLDAWGWLRDFRVEVQGSSWRYRLVEPSVDYTEFRGWLRPSRVFLAQIEGDGRIFVLPIGSELSLDPQLAQPEGFPLVPDVR